MLKYLHIVPFSGLFNWSVQYLVEKKISFNTTYPLMRIGDFLKRNKTVVEIADDECYKRATIKTHNGGIGLRDEEIGAKIGTKRQFVIRKGQFLLSKIDARNGAFGVIPSVLDGGIITGNFWAFDVDCDKINPHYLSLVVTTKEFLILCAKASNGTTNRHYLQEILFLNIEIPLPPLEVQDQLVEKYNQQMRIVDELECAALSMQSGIEGYLLDKLGVKDSPHVVKSGLQFMTFSELNVWGVERLLSEKSGSILVTDKYPNVKLGSLVLINPATNLRDLPDEAEMSFIPMECISDLYGEWIDTKTGRKSASGGYTKFQDGDLIWARISPCMENGKSAIISGLSSGYGYGSTEFHVLRSSNEGVSLNYIHALLRLPVVLKNASSFFTGSAGQQRVPKSYLANLSIPLPPLEVQSEIAEYVKERQKDVKKLRQQASESRIQALKTFKRKIFE